MSARIVPFALREVSGVVTGIDIEDARRSHQATGSARLHVAQAVDQPLDPAAGERLAALAADEDLGERQDVELGDPRMGPLERHEPAFIEQHLAEAYVRPLGVALQKLRQLVRPRGARGAVALA